MAENKNLQMFVTDNYFDNCLASGYRRLADCPEVATAIHEIAELVSSMTIKLMKNTDGGNVEIHNNISRKVDINPYKYLSRKEWVYLIVKNLLLEGEGNAIVYPKFNKFGELEDLQPLPPSKIAFQGDEFDYQIIYNFKQIFQYDEVLHFRYKNDVEKPWFGTGLRIQAKDILNNLKQASKTKNSFMSGKYMPSLIVKVDANTLELASEEGREQVFDMYLKREKAGEPWVIPAEMIDVQQIKPLSLNDIAIKDNVDVEKVTLAKLLGVPPFILGVGKYNKAEYNNFIDTTIKTIAEIIQSELTGKLLLADDEFFRLNVRSLKAYDFKELADVGGQLYVRGIVTGNEVRNWLSMSPLEDLDNLVILENFIPAGMIADQAKLNQNNNDD